LVDNGRTSERAAQAENHVGIGKRRVSRRGVWFMVVVAVVVWVQVNSSSTAVQ
jgi:hypothetical protein